MLMTVWRPLIGLIGNMKQRTRRHFDSTRRRDEAATKVTETIPILPDLNRWIDHEQICRQYIRRTRIVRVEHQHHRGALFALVDQFIANTKYHYTAFLR